MELPPLDNLAYLVDDEGEHPGGGHCAALTFDGDRDAARSAIVDQYSTALRVLVDAAELSEGEWSLTRPILFAVHQLCEDALDAANNHHPIRVAKGSHPHDLGPKMAAALEGGVYDNLEPEARQWCEDFIAKMVPLTGNGFPGRYADGKVSGKVRLDDKWCCINPSALRETATQFAGFTLLGAEELANPELEISAP